MDEYFVKLRMWRQFRFSIVYVTCYFFPFLWVRPFSVGKCGKSYFKGKHKRRSFTSTYYCDETRESCGWNTLSLRNIEVNCKYWRKKSMIIRFFIILVFLRRLKNELLFPMDITGIAVRNFSANKKIVAITFLFIG